MKPTTESANAQSLSGAAIGNTSAIGEGASAQGVYHAICRGYKEEHKAEYLTLWEKAQKLRQSIGDAISKELANLEAYMESLTEVKWDEYAHNVVCTVGKNLALDTFLAGSGYTVTGPYMGLIGAVGYTGVPVAADTMASHATWTEAGTTNAPTYTAPRKTIAWAAASAGSKAPSAAPVYAITGTGTVKGVFLCFGSGAVSTIDSTAGTLWSAGLFSGGDQAVVNTNTVTVTYSTSM
jgi:hypothetical protein